MKTESKIKPLRGHDYEKRSIRVHMDVNQWNMVNELMAHYRANGLSHTIRLAIEDAHDRMKKDVQI